MLFLSSTSRHSDSTLIEPLTKYIQFNNRVDTTKIAAAQHEDAFTYFSKAAQLWPSSDEANRRAYVPMKAGAWCLERTSWQRSECGWYRLRPLPQGWLRPMPLFSSMHVNLGYLLINKQLPPEWIGPSDSRCRYIREGAQQSRPLIACADRRPDCGRVDAAPHSDAVIPADPVAEASQPVHLRGSLAADSQRGKNAFILILLMSQDKTHA